MSLGAGPEHNIPFTPQRSVCKSVLSIMGLVKTCGSQTQAPGGTRMALVHSAAFTEHLLYTRGCARLRSYQEDQT